MRGRGNLRQKERESRLIQIVWWNGKAIDRQSGEFAALVRQAYNAMFEQSEGFRTALMATRGMALYHTKGESNPYRTILTEQEFCSILPQFGIRIVHKKLVVSQIFCTFIGDLQQVTNIFDMTTDYKVTELFCIIDEFCKHFDAENAGNLLEDDASARLSW